MAAQWSWIVRLLGMFLLVPVRVSKGAGIVRRGRPAVAFSVLFWTSLWILGLCVLFWGIIHQDNAGCFQDVVHKTMRVYNAKIVVTLVAFLVYFTNVFCLARMYWRDLTNLIGRNLDLYAKAAGRMKKIRLFALSNTLKTFLVFLLLFKFVALNAILLLCNSGDSLPWGGILFTSVNCVFDLPSTSMVTVFFILLITVEESLALIHRQLMVLYASKTPRAFLEAERSPLPETTSRAPLTAHRIHTLRMVHFELVEFMEDVMGQFQTDILFLFLMSFCQNVMFVYSIVFNHRDMFHDKRTFYFVSHSLYSTVDLVTGLWMTCSGPTRIKDKQGDLLHSTTRLSTILNQPSDVSFEIRIFQLQVRNHAPSFEVFGMFELSFSLLFKMCASIISYIVILIQFGLSTPDSKLSTIANITHPINASAL